MSKEIVVITNGFVFMGEVSEAGTYLRIDDAACIRVWGTTHGLGEIALRGVTTATVLDPAGLVAAATGMAARPTRLRTQR